MPAPAFLSRAAGTLTLPLGDRFGLQADLSLASPGFSAGGALHLFTRDPQSYLIGGALGLVRTPGALVVAAGPEAELYFDRWTLEAWGGLSYAHSAGASDRVAPFVMADVATYPTDNLRLSLGLSLVDGYTALHGGAEYLIDNAGLPLAVTADARLGSDGAVRATLGLKAFLGGPAKTLIRRHREDDPTDRGAALYAALGSQTLHPEAARRNGSAGARPKDNTAAAGGDSDAPPASSADGDEDNGTPPADPNDHDDGAPPADGGDNGMGDGTGGADDAPSTAPGDGDDTGGGTTTPAADPGDGGDDTAGGDPPADPDGDDDGAAPGEDDTPPVLSCTDPGQEPAWMGDGWICGFPAGPADDPPVDPSGDDDDPPAMPGEGDTPPVLPCTDPCGPPAGPGGSGDDDVGEPQDGSPIGPGDGESPTGPGDGDEDDGSPDGDDTSPAGPGDDADGFGGGDGGPADGLDEGDDDESPPPPSCTAPGQEPAWIDDAWVCGSPAGPGGGDDDAGGPGDDPSIGPGDGDEGPGGDGESPIGPGDGGEDNDSPDGDDTAPAGPGDDNGPLPPSCAGPGQEPIWVEDAWVCDSPAGPGDDDGFGGGDGGPADGPDEGDDESPSPPSCSGPGQEPAWIDDAWICADP